MHKESLDQVHSPKAGLRLGDRWVSPPANLQEVWQQSSAFPAVQRSDPEERSICRNAVPWEDTNPLPASPALDWLKSPRHHLIPKSSMPRVPQGPTTTALPPCNQSSDCQFLFQLLSVQRARAVLTVVFPSFFIYRLSNCIWSRQREETNNTAEHLRTLIANYS